MTEKITKSQLFDLLTEKFADIQMQEIKHNGVNIYGIKVLGEYPEEVYNFDDPEYKRDVDCIFHGVLYITKEDVIDLLRGKGVPIYPNKGGAIFTIEVEE